MRQPTFQGTGHILPEPMKSSLKKMSQKEFAEKYNSFRLPLGNAGE